MPNELVQDAVALANQRQNIQDIGAAWMEVHDIQKKITEDYDRHNNTLTKMLGLGKSVQMNIIDRFKREIDLRKGLKNLEKEISNLQEKSHGIVDKAARQEAKVSLEGMLQRKTAWEKELSLIAKVNRFGIGIFFSILNRSIDLFKILDKAAENFRMTMGFTRNTAQDIRAIAQRIAIDFMHVGVSIDGAYNSFVALSNEMGSAHAISIELVKTTAILRSQLGVSEEASAGFLKNMAAIAGSSMEAQQSMAFMAGALSNAVGVPLNLVMKDIATKSASTLTMMSRLPGQVIRTAVELRKMGTDLDRSAKASEDILNFTESIQAEMEASVLLGHSINLQKARELAYNRDIIGSTKEILKLTKQNNFAHGMDVFQQRAFAKATGRSVDELLSLVQAEEQWNRAKNSQDPKMRARIEAAEKLMASNEASLKDAGKQLEMEILRTSNQARLTAISQKWSQIMAKAGEVFLPVIDNVLGFIADNLEGIVAGTVGLWSIWKILKFDAFAFGKQMGTIFSRTTGFFGGLLEKFGSLFKVIGRIAVPLIFVWNIFKKIQGILSDKKLMGTDGFLAFNLKLIPRAFGEIIKSLWLTINDLFLGLPGLIGKGIANAGGYIYDVLITPFKKAWDWLGKRFLGKSPSELGLSIANGIESVAGMIFDSLSKPFRMFLAWVVDKIPMMGKFAEKIRGGIAGGVESRATGTYLPAATITPTGTTIAGEKPVTQEQATAAVTETNFMTESTGKSLLNAIMGLREDLNAGKIAVYMDTQLVSATVARQTEFRGGFGVNKIN